MGFLFRLAVFVGFLSLAFAAGYWLGDHRLDDVSDHVKSLKDELTDKTASIDRPKSLSQYVEDGACSGMVRCKAEQGIPSSVTDKCCFPPERTGSYVSTQGRLTTQL